jgi:hypothetical protein
MTAALHRTSTRHARLLTAAPLDTPPPAAPQARPARGRRSSPSASRAPAGARRPAPGATHALLCPPAPPVAACTLLSHTLRSDFPASLAITPPTPTLHPPPPTPSLDYAILSGGDIAPLEGGAVTQLHSTFDWAERSRKVRGLVCLQTPQARSQCPPGCSPPLLPSPVLPATAHSPPPYHSRPPNRHPHPGPAPLHRRGGRLPRPPLRRDVRGAPRRAQRDAVPHGRPEPRLHGGPRHQPPGCAAGHGWSGRGFGGGRPSWWCSPPTARVRGWARVGRQGVRRGAPGSGVDEGGGVTAARRRGDVSAARPALTRLTPPKPQARPAKASPRTSLATPLPRRPGRRGAGPHGRGPGVWAARQGAARVAAQAVPGQVRGGWEPGWPQ